MISRAFGAQQRSAVRPLEAEIHLQTAVVGRARVGPRPLVVVVTGGSGESSARRAEALNVAASAHAHASAIVCLTFIERSPRIRSHATVPQWWPLVVRVVRRSPAARVSKLRDKSHEAGVGL